MNWKQVLRNLHENYKPNDGLTYAIQKNRLNMFSLHLLDIKSKNPMDLRLGGKLCQGNLKDIINFLKTYMIKIEKDENRVIYKADNVGDIYYLIFPENFHQL